MEKDPLAESKISDTEAAVLQILQKQWEPIEWEVRGRQLGLFNTGTLRSVRKGHIPARNSYWYIEEIATRYTFGRAREKSHTITITEVSGQGSGPELHDMITDFIVDVETGNLSVDQNLSAYARNDKSRSFASEHYPSYGIAGKPLEQQWERLLELVEEWKHHEPIQE